MGHTPGPWEWLEDKFNGGYSGLVAPRTGEEVLFPNHRNEGDDGDAWFEDFPNEANAHLIAAAPQLLEALETAMSYLESFKNEWQEGEDLLYTTMQAALKKAKGA